MSPQTHTQEDADTPSSPLLQACIEKRVRNLRWGLMLLWVAATFGGWHFGLWMGAQGLVLLFLALTWIFALCVNHWESQLN
jgi:hypothetical protein